MNDEKNRPSFDSSVKRLVSWASRYGLDETDTSGQTALYRFICLQNKLLDTNVYPFVGTNPYGFFQNASGSYLFHAETVRAIQQSLLAELNLNWNTQ